MESHQTPAVSANALRAENERLKVERSLAESRLNACEMVRDMVVLERDSALARLASADADSARPSNAPGGEEKHDG